MSENRGFPTFDHYNLQLQERSPGTVVEYSMSHGSSETHKDLELATADVLIAMDAAMRGDSQSSSLYAQVEAIHAELAQQGLALNTRPQEQQRYGQGIMGLYRLSARLSQGLARPRAHQYSIGGMGTPDGGYNEFAQAAASLGFDYSSPLERVANDAHWYKTTLQFIQEHPGRLAVGAYAIGMRQRVPADKLRTELESPQLHQFLRRKPYATVAPEARQPVAIPELHFNAWGIEEVWNGLRLPGFSQILNETAERTGFTYTPPASKSSHHNLSAYSKLTDEQTGLGLQVEVRGARREYGNGMDYRFDYDEETDTFLATLNGKPVKLEGISAQIVPIGRRSTDGSYASYRQEQVILPRFVRDTANQLGACVTALHAKLLANG